jgi:hypothetical protein
MTRLGMRFEQQVNCFTWIEDAARAQRLLDQQLNTRWAVELEQLVLENHPTYRAICRPIALSYYWTACESEYATEVMFARPPRLAQLYPCVVHHGIKRFGSRECSGFQATSRRPTGWASLRGNSTATSRRGQKDCASNILSTATRSSFRTNRTRLRPAGKSFAHLNFVAADVRRLKSKPEISQSLLTSAATGSPP